MDLPPTERKDLGSGNAHVGTGALASLPRAQSRGPAEPCSAVLRIFVGAGFVMLTAESPSTLRPRLFLAIALLALAGIAVSSVSLAHHYGTSKTAYCDFGETLNCDVVNRSSYSSIMGIPVALIGILGYLALLALATLYRSKPDTPAALFFAGLAGLAFALYLTYIEGFVLGVWCILCLSSLLLIFCITLLSSIMLLPRPGRDSAT